MDKMDLLMMMLLKDSFSEGDASDELMKLDKLLKAADIPFENSGRQICYYGPEGRPKPKENVYTGVGWGAICSVIAYGYGSSEGLLEISGLMTEEEMDEVNDTVLGNLTAENVFARIKAHYESCK